MARSAREQLTERAISARAARVSHILTDCLTCCSLSGEAPLAPGPAVHVGRFWVIEHAYPCRLKGWLVLVLRRHAPALHELTGEEWAELADLQQRAALFLRREVGCEKEYVMCFAESPRHQHVHVYVIGKPANLPAEFKEAHVFGLMAASENEPGVVPRDEMVAFCERLRERWAAAATITTTVL